MKKDNLIRVMIVDDHLMVRDGLKVFLSTYADLQVVGEARDGEQAVAVCEQVNPDVILMDIMMPNMDGPTATQRIREEYPSVQVIALTSFTDSDLVQQAIQSGAIAFVLKDTRPDQLAGAIRAAYQGQVTLDPAAAQALVESTQAPPSIGGDLTNRELEILSKLVDGMSNKQIGATLSISPGTVRFHVSNIISKLCVSNRTEAVSQALQLRLVNIDIDKPG